MYLKVDGAFLIEYDTVYCLRRIVQACRR
jgi:hypothetical protein